MRNYRPLLIQDIGVTMAGVTVRRLRLNQHTPEAQWSPHRHECGQLLVYLAGRGHQTVEGKPHAARPGTVVYVAPGELHAFERKQVRPPLCLVLDLDLGPSPWPVHTCTQMANADLAQVRDAVARLFRSRDIERREMALVVGSIVLEILHVALKTAGWLRPVNRFGDSRRLGTTRMVERAFDRYQDQGLSLDELAKRIGYQHDYLNRVLKEECGLTLGQLRARHQLRRAQLLLQRPELAVFEVAEKVGFDDHNYFSRWFRQQTGTTPTRWRKNPQPLPPV
jgi:AraC family L-rhamnose operon transcriptional activator RhaR